MMSLLKEISVMWRCGSEQLNQTHFDRYASPVATTALDMDKPFVFKRNALVAYVQSAKGKRFNKD